MIQVLEGLDDCSPCAARRRLSGLGELDPATSQMITGVAVLAALVIGYKVVSRRRRRRNRR